MKAAIPYENGQIFQHFGHTAQFKLYELQGGKVVSSQVVDTNGSGHGALAGFLQAQGVETLVCGGIGGGAKTALAQCTHHAHEEGHTCGDHGCGGGEGHACGGCRH